MKSVGNAKIPILSISRYFPNQIKKMTHMIAIVIEAQKSNTNIDFGFCVNQSDARTMRLFAVDAMDAGIPSKKLIPAKDQNV